MSVSRDARGRWTRTAHPPTSDRVPTVGTAPHTPKKEPEPDVDYESQAIRRADRPGLEAGANFWDLSGGSSGSAAAGSSPIR